MQRRYLRTSRPFCGAGATPFKRDWLRSVRFREHSRSHLVVTQNLLPWVVDMDKVIISENGRGVDHKRVFFGGCCVAVGAGQGSRHGLRRTVWKLRVKTPKFLRTSAPLYS